MARTEDLDLVVKPPVRFKFQGQVYEIHEPTMAQILKHSQLMDQLETLRKETIKLQEEDKPEELEAKLKEFARFSKDIDQEIIETFIPDMQGKYLELTASQKDKIFALLFGSAEENQGEGEKVKKKEEPPGEK